MTQIEVIIDNESRLGAHYQGIKLDGNLSLSLEDIKSVDKMAYAGLSLLQKSFFPEVEDWKPVIIASKGGAFAGCYAPVVRQVDGRMVVSAGLVNVPITVQKDKKTAFTKGKDESTIYLELVDQEFNGYESKALVFTWELETATVNLYLSLGIQKPKEGEDELKIPQLKNLLLSDKLGSVLMDPPKPNLMAVPAKYLPKGQYTVVGWSTWISKKTGDSVYTIQVKPTLDDNGIPAEVMHDPQTPEEEKFPLDSPLVSVPVEGFNVFAPSKLHAKLAEDPDFSPEKPGTFIVFGAKKSKNGISLDCGLVYNDNQVFRNAPTYSEEDFDLSSLGL